MLNVETGVPESFLIFSLHKKYFHISTFLNTTFLPLIFFIFLNYIFWKVTSDQNLQVDHNMAFNSFFFWDDIVFNDPHQINSVNLDFVNGTTFQSSVNFIPSPAY